MAVEVGRRVAGFKEEQAWRVMEESWRKETRSNKIQQGGRVLKPLYVRSSAR
jgi:lipopolysaccharide biosynthesis protein